ncbi:hypothetical protein SAY87_006973 [Trapa incisa]|uniref:Pectinesterase inhibitor domain-containing protein n=1 Tax=Trapa incisa TaxID=236973 RepID=A0AAN7K051_9MYRT|nr:hypothetical protein SAY87_006973 [Trapa incisa]
MAFQDFDYLSERRKAERSRKLKRRITIAALTSLVLAAVVATGVIAVVHGGYGPKSSNKANDEPAPASPSKQISHSEKAITTMCSSTDYPETCKSALEKASKGHQAQPKDLVKMSIKAAGDEVSATLMKTEKFNFKSDQEKGAFEDCKKLFSDAREELNISASSIVGDVKQLTSKSSDLNNWLSAVRSYQETCVDGFPDGNIKADMKKALKTANELTSNSLAIISKLSSFLSTFGVDRHLLAEKPSRALDVDEEGFATWMSGEERRMLKGSSNKPTPNVTVAKDGSGQFKTINAALAALPETYTGRVNWAGYQKDFSRADAEKFTVGTFLEADWIKAAKVPVRIGLN